MRMGHSRRKGVRTKLPPLPVVPGLAEKLEGNPPTAELPGSVMKQVIMSYRFDMGWPVFHPDDARRSTR